MKSGDDSGFSQGGVGVDPGAVGLGVSRYIVSNGETHEDFHIYWEGKQRTNADFQTTKPCR